MEARWTRWPWLPVLGGTLIGVLVYIAMARARMQPSSAGDRPTPQVTAGRSAK